MANNLARKRPTNRKKQNKRAALKKQKTSDELVAKTGRSFADKVVVRRAALRFPRSVVIIKRCSD